MTLPFRIFKVQPITAESQLEEMIQKLGADKGERQGLQFLAFPLFFS